MKVETAGAPGVSQPGAGHSSGKSDMDFLFEEKKKKNKKRKKKTGMWHLQQFKCRKIVLREFLLSEHANGDAPKM